MELSKQATSVAQCVEKTLCWSIGPKFACWVSHFAYGHLLNTERRYGDVLNMYCIVKMCMMMVSTRRGSVQSSIRGKNTVIPTPPRKVHNLV
ncbi:hypothetical protein BDN70DRAFT_709810 [Pholiota conissans]|uniref:Uncharacterized protein n=1 Tax=Pholiota conissans TaxID=109636 RepID=A0A9P6D095_9AGAR|nr:hypothetical protein BDN70DRAFT_709810 [Pholiota conissans]